MLAPSKAYATLNPHPHHHAHLVAPPLPTTHDAVAHHHNAVLLQLDPPHTGLDALQARADDHHLPLVPTHHVTDDVHHQHLAPSEHHPHEEDEDNPHTHHHHAHHHAQLSALEDQHHLTHLGQSPDDAVGQETLEPLPPITEVDPLSGKTFSREMAAMYSAGMVPPAHPILAPMYTPTLNTSPATIDEMPLYVNAKQYNRILKRRAARAKQEHDNVILPRKGYLHQSRHKWAKGRKRGPGGRFLSRGEAGRDDEEEEEEDDNDKNGHTQHLEHHQEHHQPLQQIQPHPGSSPLQPIHQQLPPQLLQHHPTVSMTDQTVHTTNLQPEDNADVSHLIHQRKRLKTG
eukprot:TRINITY_DN5478_c0_g1_i2.p1 TRINITY_DN5478_c0_g1~~TRINITY_DN5478_c0_g1_i2.p1  ORF type:complete len:344 (+),score=72.55 TRINITY_DN5478_c0_g1_i2:98-1129(+)